MRPLGHAHPKRPSGGNSTHAGPSIAMRVHFYYLGKMLKEY
jgi:hypothetical protein